MAEDFILPEAAENTFTHRGRSPVSLLLKCVLRNGEDRRLIQLPRKYSLLILIFTFERLVIT